MNNHSVGSCRRPSTSHSKGQIDSRHLIEIDTTEMEKPMSRDHQSSRRVQLPKASDIVALDCEMVGVGNKGRISSAAWITIIDWFGNVVLDEFISQEEPVTDFRTAVSGVTEENLRRATMTLAECRQVVLKILGGRILVGHSLKSDLNALGITHNNNHPWWLLRDTARYTPFLQDLSGTGTLMPRKLRDLAKERLKRDIQVAGRPHSPYEDALASLDLYKSVRTKWEATIAFKMKKTLRIQREQQKQQ